MVEETRNKFTDQTPRFECNQPFGLKKKFNIQKLILLFWDFSWITNLIEHFWYVNFVVKQPQRVGILKFGDGRPCMSYHISHVFQGLVLRMLYFITTKIKWRDTSMKIKSTFCIAFAVGIFYLIIFTLVIMIFVLAAFNLSPSLVEFYALPRIWFNSLDFKIL